MRKQITFLVLGLLLSLGSVQAQFWTQIGQDIYGEAENDFSGISTSISSDGSIVAIGAHANDGSGTDAGQVRVYELLSGTWTQVGQDIDGEAAGDKSGYSVSISSDGSIVAIGSYYNSDNGTEAGHVRVYENQGGTWTQIGEDIDGEAAEDRSGFSISLNSDGSVLAIGAIFNDGNGFSSGHVRVFENQGGTWTQIGEDIDGEAEVDLFGYSVSLNSDGSILAAGANANDVAGFDAGNVRVFENQNGTWVQIGENINGEAAEDRFGNAVSLSSDGTVVAIGAPSNGASPGQVSVFENLAGTWTQIGEDIDGDVEGDMAGKRVSLSSDGLVVAFGAVFNDNNGSNAGLVRVYKNQNGTWTQMGEDINGESAGDMEGTSLCINSDGSVLATGAVFNGGNGTNSGQVRIYENLTTNIESIYRNEIMIYPNPTTGIINLELFPESKDVAIMDITGKIVFSSENSVGKQIDISNFENGIYFVEIQTNNEIIIKKIIKN